MYINEILKEWKQPQKIESDLQIRGEALRLGHQPRALTVVYSFHILVCNDQEFPCNLYRLPKSLQKLKRFLFGFT